MALTTAEQIEARENEIRLKRAAVLLGAYDMMRQLFVEVRENTHFNSSLAAATVEDYIGQRRLIVGRDNITGRIQRHKIAGLMATAIARNRPIQLVVDDPDNPGPARLSRDNEVLAVMVGLAVCAENRTQEEIHRLLDLPHFRKWFWDMVFQVHNDPANSAALTIAFETLCLQHFSDNLDHVE